MTPTSSTIRLIIIEAVPKGGPSVSMIMNSDWDDAGREVGTLFIGYAPSQGKQGTPPSLSVIPASPMMGLRTEAAHPGSGLNQEQGSKHSLRFVFCPLLLHSPAH